MNIKLSLNEQSIDKAIKQLEAYGRRVNEAAEKIAKGLADMGFEVMVEIINAHYFTGATADSLTCLQEGPGKYVIYAESEAILFLEFGAGAKYGYGHPMAKEFGYGPGTYPSTSPNGNHYQDPNGWWYPTSDPRLIRSINSKGQGFGHSYGNAPRMPFYLADRKMRENILNVAKEAIKAGDDHD